MKTAFWSKVLLEKRGKKPFTHSTTQIYKQLENRPTLSIIQRDWVDDFAWIFHLLDLHESVNILPKKVYRHDCVIIYNTIVTTKIVIKTECIMRL